MPKTTTKTAAQHDVWEIFSNESIAEFLERVGDFRVCQQGNGYRSWHEPVILTPIVACDVSGYAFDECGTEQEEPVSGAQYRFAACRNHPMTPYGGYDFVATCHREGDVAYFQIEQA